MAYFWCLIWGAQWIFKWTYLHLLLRTRSFSSWWCKFAYAAQFVPKIMHQNLAIILWQMYYSKINFAVCVPDRLTVLTVAVKLSCKYYLLGRQRATSNSTLTKKYAWISWSAYYIHYSLTYLITNRQTIHRDWAENSHRKEKHYTALWQILPVFYSRN